MNSSKEISSIRELPELGLMEDPNLFNQWHMDSLDELSVLPVSASFGENLQYSAVETSRPAAIYRPPKQLKTNGWNSSRTDAAHITNLQSTFSPNTLPFSNSNHNPFGSQKYVLKGCHGTGKRISQTDHIMAERKRREKLSQKFIALSAIVPGLKKMDKATVLGDAIKYLKQLQEKVMTLEEQVRQKSMESVVFVKKYQLLADIDDFSSSDGKFSSPFDEPLPEIEARFCDRSVLIRIHCEKRKGFPEKIISEIEKCHLTVINSNVMTFGICALHVAIVAQMDMEFCMTVKDLVKKLRSAFKFLI